MGKMGRGRGELVIIVVSWLKNCRFRRLKGVEEFRTGRSSKFGSSEV